jgi:hypothetical protein
MNLLPGEQLREPAACCAQCVHFDASPKTLEKELKGLRVMGSAHGSVRSNDGLCHRKQRYLSGHYRCQDLTIQWGYR